MSSSGPAGSRRGNRATARRVHKLDLPSKDADQPPRLTSPPTGRITPKNSEVDRPDELASDQCSRAAVPRSGCLVRTIYLQWAIPLTHPEVVSSVGVWGSSPLWAALGPGSSTRVTVVSSSAGSWTRRAVRLTLSGCAGRRGLCVRGAAGGVVG